MGGLGELWMTYKIIANISKTITAQKQKNFTAQTKHKQNKLFSQGFASGGGLASSQSICGNE